MGRRICGTLIIGGGFIIGNTLAYSYSVCTGDTAAQWIAQIKLDGWEHNLSCGLPSVHRRVPIDN